MEAQREIQNAAVVRAKGAPKSARTVRRGAAPASPPEGGGTLGGARCGNLVAGAVRGVLPVRELFGGVGRVPVSGGARGGAL